MKQCLGKVVFLRTSLQIVEIDLLIAQAGVTAMTTTSTAFRVYKTVLKSSKLSFLAKTIKKNKHDEQHTEYGTAIDTNALAGAEPGQNEIVDELLSVNDVNAEDATRSGVFTLLSLQECSKPKLTVELVISNTTSTVQQAVSVV